MADLQVGNRHGVTAKTGHRPLLATVTADGVNTITVDTPANIAVGSVIDIVHKTTGAELAVDRTVTSITSAGVVTYDGADVAATTDHGVYLANEYATTAPNNINGGPTPGKGFELGSLDSIDEMRARLAAIDGTEYTAARLNSMTYNDMVFAIRLNDASGSF